MGSGNYVVENMLFQKHVMNAMKLLLQGFLMPMANMAEYTDAVVAAALSARVGATYSIGNATCRMSTSRLATLDVHALLVPVVLVDLVAWVQVLRCPAGLRLGDVLREGLAWQRGEFAQLRRCRLLRLLSVCMSAYLGHLVSACGGSLSCLLQTR